MASLGQSSLYLSVTHGTRGRKSSASSRGLPMGCPRTLNSLTRLMGLHHPNRCSHSHGAWLPRLSQAPVAPPLRPRTEHSSLNSDQRTRGGCHSQSNHVRVTGRSSHTGLSSELNQTGSPSPHGGFPSRALGVPSCLSGVAMTLTSKDHGTRLHSLPQAPRPCTFSHLLPGPQALNTTCQVPPPTYGLSQGTYLRLGQNQTLPNISQAALRMVLIK